MSKRRIVLILTLITAVVGGIPAAGWSQTTSSSSSSSSTSSSTTTSSTTSTTVPDPCLVTGGCTAGPPAGYVRASAGERPGVMGGYCWRQPPGSSGGGGLSVCTSVLLVAPFPHESLVVRPGEELTLRFDPALRPESATITRSSSFPSVSDQNVATPNGSPITFRADFPEGEHYVTASVKFSQGTAPYIFRITVRPAPAPGPTPGPVRFTG